MSLWERSQTLGEVEKKFHVPVNFPDLPNGELKKQCETLSNTMSCNGRSDLDGKELALGLQTFPDLPKHKMTTLELLCFLQEKKLRIAVTAAERSFSKLKLIKTYVRSTMSQERLSGLALITINPEVSRQVSFDDTMIPLLQGSPECTVLNESAAL